MGPKIKLCLFFAIFINSLHSNACDDLIRQFTADCKIQDQFQELQLKFDKFDVSLDQVAEYRALRFISRQDWNSGKLKKKSVDQIYDPAPQTWQAWSRGIDMILSNNELKMKSLTLDQLVEIHSYLLPKEIQDPNTDFTTNGNVRRANNKGVGYCSALPRGPADDEILKLQNKLSGLDRELKSIIKKYVISQPDTPVSVAQFNEMRPILFLTTSSMLSPAAQIQNTFCQKGNTNYNYVFVNYAPSVENEANLKIWLTFVRRVMQSYEDGKPLLAPIKFAAIAQKWFVTLHPFSDGNGRTSRALQELILKELGLPRVPAGDLQDDAMSLTEEYVNANYQNTSKMLSRMSSCASRFKMKKDYSCFLISNKIQ